MLTPACHASSPTHLTPAPLLVPHLRAPCTAPPAPPFPAALPAAFTAAVRGGPYEAALRPAPLLSHPCPPHRPAFLQIVEDIKRRPYDLLDFCRTQYDRDLLEFNVQINDLEAALQVGAVG